MASNSHSQLDWMKLVVILFASGSLFVFFIANILGWLYYWNRTGRTELIIDIKLKAWIKVFLGGWVGVVYCDS